MGATILGWEEMSEEMNSEFGGDGRYEKGRYLCTTLGLNGKCLREEGRSRESQERECGSMWENGGTKKVSLNKKID